MSGSTRPVLSISMLVSNNRGDTIKKCMESMLPLRRAVPSELILVDTGCTDGSIEIAGEYADRVVQFPWCDDFAAARNAGLSLCTGEWFMFIDDDEWFEDVSEIIWFFGSGEYKKYTKGTYIARNYENQEGTSYQDTMAGRLCRLVPGLRFEGRLHEYLPVQEGAVYHFDCFVHHYGYAYRTEEERRKHAERNFSILRRMTEEEPENLQTAAYLLQEYMASGKFAEAEVFCKKTLELCRRLKKRDFYEYLLLTLPEVYCKEGKYEEAEEEYLRIQEEEPLTKYALTKLWAEKCVLEKCKHQDMEVLDAVRMYIVLYEDQENRGTGILDLLYYSTPVCFRRILEFGFEAMFSQKAFSFAALFFSRVDWSEKKQLPYARVADLQRYLAESGDLELFCKCSERILRVPELREMFFPALQTMVTRYPEQEVLFTEAVHRLRPPKVNAELAALGEQMKGIIEELIANGNTAEAGKLLSEVEFLLPGAEWIRELQGRIKQ